MSQKYEIIDGVYVGPEVWEGKLGIIGTDLKSLGKLKVVTGSMYAYGVSTLCDLGCLEEVGGSLYIRGTSVRSLGCLKKVGSDLNALGVNTLYDLGCLEEVGRYLYITGTSVRSLNNLKKVGGGLDAEGVSTLCDFGCLEEVDGYLDIRGTRVNSLGSLTKVGTFYKLDGSGGSVPYEDFLKELELLRSIPASELSMYLYDPRYTHPLHHEALGRS